MCTCNWRTFKTHLYAFAECMFCSKLVLKFVDTKWIKHGCFLWIFPQWMNILFRFFIIFRKQWNYNSLQEYVQVASKSFLYQINFMILQARTLSRFHVLGKYEETACWACLFLPDLGVEAKMMPYITLGFNV